MACTIGNPIVSDYRAIREAAAHSQEAVEISESLTPAHIDSVTSESVTVSTWDGCMSHSAVQSSYREKNEGGRHILEVETHTPLGMGGEAGDDLKVRKFDLESGELLGCWENGAPCNCEGIVAAPPAPPPAASEDQRILEEFNAIRQAIREHPGETEMAYGVGSLTVVKDEPNYLQVVTWDGGFSSPQITQTFDSREQGKMIYRRETPPNPFMMGDQGESITRTLEVWG